MPYAFNFVITCADYGAKLASPHSFRVLSYLRCADVQTDNLRVKWPLKCKFPFFPATVVLDRGSIRTSTVWCSSVAPRAPCKCNRCRRVKSISEIVIYCIKLLCTSFSGYQFFVVFLDSLSVSLAQKSTHVSDVNHDQGLANFLKI